MGYLHMQRRQLRQLEEATLAEGLAGAVASTRRSRTAPPASTSAGVSAQDPDWDREACRPWTWHPARQVLRSIRDYQRAKEGEGFLARTQGKLAVIRHRFWSAVSGSDVPLNSSIAGGLVLPHPNGVVLHPEARIGPNCILFQQVTIGTGPKPGVPELGGHVDVGPGAKILGGVRIGDHAVIGANAVVLSDVPEGCVAVGIPASVKRVVHYVPGTDEDC
jgi:serine O-acetyltransferase